MSNQPRSRELDDRWDDDESGRSPVVDAALTVLRWIVVSFGLAAVLITVLGLILGWQPAIVRTGSMEPAIPTGSVVLLRPADASSVQVGEVIGAREGNKLILHRVVSVSTADSGAITLVMKGDANKAADPEVTVTKVFRPLTTLPAVAQPLAKMNGRMEQFFLGLLAGGLVAFFVWRRMVANEDELDDDELMAAWKAEATELQQKKQAANKAKLSTPDDASTAHQELSELARPAAAQHELSELARPASAEREPARPASAERELGELARSASAEREPARAATAEREPARPAMERDVSEATPSADRASALAEAKAAAVAAATAAVAPRPAPPVTPSPASAVAPSSHPHPGAAAAMAISPAMGISAPAAVVAASAHQPIVIGTPLSSRSAQVPSAATGWAEPTPITDDEPAPQLKPFFDLKPRPLPEPAPMTMSVTAPPPAPVTAPASATALVPVPAPVPVSAPASMSAFAPVPVPASAPEVAVVFGHAPTSAAISVSVPDSVPETTARMIPVPRQPEPASSHQEVAAVESLIGAPPADILASDPRAADRLALQSFGVPERWTRDLHGSDRFDAVLDMLRHAPELGDVPDPRVVAVIGGPHAVQRESHRIAVDLQDGAHPRPVLRLPIAPPSPHDAGAGATPQVMVAMPVSGSGAMVVAIECPDGAEKLGAATIPAVGADLVIAALRARRSYGELMSALRGLDRPLAVTFEGPARLQDVMPFLTAGVPVMRVDGVPLDRLSLAALLCGYLTTAGRRPAQREGVVLDAATMATAGRAPSTAAGSVDGSGAELIGADWRGSPS